MKLNRSTALILFSLLSFLILTIVFFMKTRTPSVALLGFSKVERGAIQSKYFTSGSLVYRNQARLSSELVAKISKIYVLEGDQVDIGQELVKLDDVSVRAEIAQAEAQLARARIDVMRLERELEGKYSDWLRILELQSKGMVSKQAADLAHVTFDSARFQLEANRKNAIQEEAALSQKMKLLEKTVIRSPIRGVVIAIPMKVGETAVASATSLAGSSLMTIADAESMLVEALIPEFDIGRIKLGQKAQMTTRSAPNVTFLGKVTKIAKSMVSDSAGKGVSDNKTIRTVSVQIEFDSLSTDFIAGMSCDLSLLESSQENALLIPLKAIRYDETKSELNFVSGSKRDYFVWVAHEGKAQKKKVELGFANEEKQEVRKGLTEGMLVVSSPPGILDAMREGDDVHEPSVK